MEAWILSVVGIVENGGLPEDSRVELKADWIEPQKAARRLAGHANSAGGEPILWIVGISEVTGVVPITPTDLASWLPQVNAAFDMLAPDIRPLVVPTERGPVVGLYVQTDRAPFVVKNPRFGSIAGDVIDREVPWREGTRIRSASRADLLRLLVPIALTPEVELLKGSVTLTVSEGHEDRYGERLETAELKPHLRWDASLELYVTPRDGDIVFPLHRTEFVLTLGDDDLVLSDVRFGVPYRFSGASVVGDSQTISCTYSEALIGGPGVLTVRAHSVEPQLDHETAPPSRLRFLVRPAGHYEPVICETGLRALDPAEAKVRSGKITWVAVSSGV